MLDISPADWDFTSVYQEHGDSKAKYGVYECL
jgi:hypothetical protein